MQHKEKCNQAKPKPDSVSSHYIKPKN